MANKTTDDFSLTVAAGYNNLRDLIDAEVSVNVPTNLWSMICITNTGASACTIRRTGKYSEAPASTTNGRNLAAGVSVVFDARQSSYIDGKGVWIYSAAGTTLDVSIMRSGK